MKTHEDPKEAQSVSITSSQGYNNKPEASFTPVANQIIRLTYKVLTGSQAGELEVGGSLMLYPE